MQINIPDVVAEVTAVFARYEAALVDNDLAVLDELFHDAPTTIRYGLAENLHGYGEITSYRHGRPPAPLARTLERTVITTYGRDFATASTLFHRPSRQDELGRQMQTWARIDGRWVVVAAHVSMITA